MLNLTLYSRLDERFHLQVGRPVSESWGSDYLFRRVRWSNIYLEDGTPGYFNSYILLWFFRWYHGNVKCDPSRCWDYWTGRLGDPHDVYDEKNPALHYVMTTTPKEGFSVRVRWRTSERTTWSSMGSI